MIQRGGLPAQVTPERTLQTFHIVRVHQFQPAGGRGTHVRWGKSEHASPPVGYIQPVAFQRPFPDPVIGAAQRVGKAAFAGNQRAVGGANVGFSGESDIKENDFQQALERR